jgi:hypothetical protein
MYDPDLATLTFQGVYVKNRESTDIVGYSQISLSKFSGGGLPQRGVQLQLYIETLNKYASFCWASEEWSMGPDYLIPEAQLIQIHTVVVR